MTKWQLHTELFVVKQQARPSYKWKRPDDGFIKRVSTETDLVNTPMDVLVKCKMGLSKTIARSPEYERELLGKVLDDIDHLLDNKIFVRR